MFYQHYLANGDSQTTRDNGTIESRNDGKNSGQKYALLGNFNCQLDFYSDGSAGNGYCGTNAYADPKYIELHKVYANAKENFILGCKGKTISELAAEGRAFRYLGEPEITKDDTVFATKSDIQFNCWLSDIVFS